MAITASLKLPRHARRKQDSQICGLAKQQAPGWPAWASPNQSTSDSPKVDQSVSKRIKTPGGGGTPVLSFYSQQDYDEDAVIEVVMNMLPFEVCAML